MSKKHCFQHHSRFSFSHFSINSYSDRSPSQILGPLSLKSETKLKGWSLNTEEVRCQLPPTFRDQIRFPTGTYLLPILPYLLLPGIQWYQWPITAQISSACAVGSGSSLDTFVFNSQEPWFNSTELYWETQRVREYLTSGWSTVWVHPNRLSPDQELIRSAWPSFPLPGIVWIIISLIRSPWPNSP